jgi:hypothetical protein
MAYIRRKPMRSKKENLRHWAVGTLTLAFLILAPWEATAEGGLSTGQTLYVPVYSHIYSGDQERPVYLAATVSIRNTDPARAIQVMTVDYYNSEGQRIQSYLEKPITLAPLATTRYVVKESDKAGGSGANFLVRWQSTAPVNPPLTESIMISTASQLGISFSSRGVPVIETKP